MRSFSNRISSSFCAASSHSLSVEVISDWIFASSRFQAGEIQSARIGQLFKQPGLPFLQLFQTAFQLGDPFLGFFPVGGQRFTRLRPRTAAVAGEVR